MIDKNLYLKGRIHLFTLQLVITHCQLILFTTLLIPKQASKFLERACTLNFKNDTNSSSSFSIASYDY